MMEQAVEELTPIVGTRPACRALGVAPATIYRRRKPPEPRPPTPRRPPARALSSQERQEILDVLHSERFVDCSPAQVWATLLDEGRYLASERTMYRLLAEHSELRERRNQLTHPSYAKPELLATRPNELWSWDITKLPGPAKWTYFYLYVLLDVFSRYVVGWTIQHRESGSVAEQLIRQALEQQNVAPGQLTVHADRGSSMTSKPVAFLLADLGVTKTHSRPYTSTDNPFSEAHFKTLKYRLPRALRRHPRRQGVRRDLLRLVQPRTPPHRPRPHDTGRGPLRPRPRAAKPTNPRPRTRLPNQPGAVRPRQAPAAQAAASRLDQPARERPRDTLISRADRLNGVDRFRPPERARLGRS